MIDRRTFIRYAGLNAIAFALPSVPVALIGTDDYVSDVYGFRLSKPHDWRWVSAADVEHARHEGKLPGGEAAKEAVSRLAGLPLLVATKYPEPRLGPTLIVWRQPAYSFHHDAKDSEGFCEVHREVYELYGDHLRGYSLKSAQPVLFAERPASRCIVHYGEDKKSGESWDVELASHVLRWQDSWLTFNFVDLRAGWGNEARSDFRRIETSMEFFPTDDPVPSPAA